MTPGPERLQCPPAGDSPGAPGIGDPVLPLIGNGGYDVDHYRLGLAIDPARNHLEGEMVIEARATQRLTSFNLDFAGPAVSEVAVDGTLAAHCHEEGELTIGPDEPVENGAAFAIAIAYSGTPEGVMRSGAPLVQGWGRLSEHEVVAGGLWGTESAFMPVNATNRDKATFDITVTVPKPLAVAASGSLQGTKETEDATTYHWVSEVPAPPSRVFMATGLWDSEEAIGPDGLVYHYLLADSAPPELGDDLGRAGAIIEALTPILGPLPFETLGFTQVESSSASTVISVHGHIFLLGIDRLGDRDLAHELGHQWFGNSLTPATTQDDWLSEGFATYVETLWVEANLGGDERNVLPRAWRGRLGDRTRPLAIVDDPAQLGDYVAYFRGGLTLHALRAEVGDDIFFRILQRYVRQFRHSSVTTEDFVAVTREESGRDLAAFFQAWLYEEEVPAIPGLDT